MKTPLLPPASALIEVIGHADAGSGAKRTARTPIGNLAAQVQGLLPPTPIVGSNRFHNSAMAINARTGSIDTVYEWFVTNAPLSYKSSVPLRRNPRLDVEDRSYPFGTTLDGWHVDFGAGYGGVGYVQQLRCFDAPEWQASTGYALGDRVRAPAGGYGVGFVFRALDELPFDRSGAGVWNSDVQFAGQGTALSADTAIWDLKPLRWALCGIYTTDEAFQDRYILRYVQSSPSAADTFIGQSIEWDEGFRSGGPVTWAGLQKAISDDPVIVVMELSRGVDAADPRNVSVITTGSEIELSSIAEVAIDTMVMPAIDTFDGVLNVRMMFPAGFVGEVWMTSQQFYSGTAVPPFSAPSQADDLEQCRRRYWTTMTGQAPVWYASWRDNFDTVAGKPKFGPVEITDIDDIYGRMKPAVMNWPIGGSPYPTRAAPDNEKERSAYGMARYDFLSTPQKAQPFYRVTLPVTVIRHPVVSTMSPIDGERNMWTLNNRRSSFLYTGLATYGSTQRAYASRGNCRTAFDMITLDAVTINMHSRTDIEDKFEEFSTRRIVQSGQDVSPSGFLSLEFLDDLWWQWTPSVVPGLAGQNYYLALDSTKYTAWSAGDYVVGDVCRAPSSLRVYACVRDHTSGSAPTDSDLNWRPLGRISQPRSVMMDGVESPNSNMVAPASMGGLNWWFGNVDNLGFETLYVCMNGTVGGSYSPGYQAGRLKAMANDSSLELYETIFTHVIVDAEFYKRPFDQQQG